MADFLKNLNCIFAANFAIVALKNIAWILFIGCGVTAGIFCAFRHRIWVACSFVWAPFSPVWDGKHGSTIQFATQIQSLTKFYCEYEA